MKRQERNKEEDDKAEFSNLFKIMKIILGNKVEQIVTLNWLLASPYDMSTMGYVEAKEHLGIYPFHVLIRDLH
ncbi:heat shock protein 83 [Calliopsis andreniformis]|uniref:heat shock protein 83 n=1 Tax=Calliopsis andreniformis TaxID=337506 RepID=UPI003FCCB0BC